MIQITGPRILKPLTLGNEIDSMIVSLGGKTPGPTDPKELSMAARMASDMAEPAAVVVWAEVKSGEADMVELITNCASRSFHLGASKNIMVPAQAALISVITLGKEFEEGCGRIARQGDPWIAYLVDRMGVMMLCRLCRRLRQTEILRKMPLGLQVGPSIGPGSVDGWDPGDQREFCSLLPIGAIDVEVDGSGVIHPFRSVSAMVGIGPGYKGRGQHNVCSLCRAPDAF